MGYVVVATGLAAALLLRLVLDPVLGDTLPLVTLFGAVAAAVWIGGPGPAVATTAIGYAACAWLFIPIELGNATDFVGLLAYLFTCSIIIVLGQAMRTAQRRAAEQGETLRLTLESVGDGLITTDREARVTSLNPSAESLTGWTQAEAAGRPLAEVFRIVNEETREPLESPALRAIRGGVTVGLADHALLLGKDGAERAIDDSAAPVRSRDGAVLGSVLVFRDVSAQRQLESRLGAQRDSSRLLAAIVESSADAIVSKTLDGIVQSWNTGAERLFGYSAVEAIGRHISFIIPPERLNEETLILSRLSAGERIEHFDTMRLRRGGDRVHVSLTISPVRDESGNIVGASKIARDISDRKDSEQRIATLVADLRDVDRGKDEFLATLAHELRGPLNPLLHSLEIMKLAEGDAELIQHSRGVMERQVRQLQRLVDDLLDVNRINRNQIELRRERVELGQVLEQALEVCRPLAESARQAIEVVAPPESPVLHGDPARLTQVFSNLLHNACKYSNPGGRIELRVERDGGVVVVTVRDDGIGISPEQIHNVFGMFTQVDHRPQRSQGGLGIGLSLVKRLVEMHGGSVTAHSEGLDRGSEFVVRLPVAPGPATAAPASVQPEVGAPAKLAARRILVVDDNEDAASSIALMLRMSGHETQIAHDGLEAVEAAEKFRPDLVVLDLELPVVDGYEVARRIREQPWGRTMLLVALTGWSQADDRRKAKEAGFDHHLVKPVAYADLVSVLGGERQAPE